jgi:hypothetical protein
MDMASNPCCCLCELSENLRQGDNSQELFLVAIFIAFQKDLEKGVPELVEQLTGGDVPESLEQLVTISVLIAAYYGVGYVKDVLVEITKEDRARRMLDALVEDAAARSGSSIDETRAALEKKYSDRKRIKKVAEAAARFFRVSKSQNNAPIDIGHKTLTTEDVAAAPSDYAYDEMNESTIYREHRRVRLDIHAQDRDKGTSGWAAVAEGVSENRIRMTIANEISASELWGVNTIIGNIVVQYKKSAQGYEPTSIQLNEVVNLK